MDQNSQTELAFKSVRSQPDMSEVFDEGGITDDGLSVDPISGNDIPAGSMAEEVRDDIPAQLSGGEYVVPADVLRFYGVKFFEELRSQAKMGLSQMEGEGRIGGEPVGMEGEEQPLSMEEEAELNAIMGMAMGGLIGEPYSAPVASASNPNNPTSPMYDPMANTAMQSNNAGYAVGGEVPANTQVMPDFSKYKAGYSFLDEQAAPAPDIAASKNVTLYGPNGEVVNLMLPSQQTQYTDLLAQGYSTQPVVQSVGQNKGRDNGNGGSSLQASPAPGTENPRSLSDMTDEQLISGARGLSTIHKIGRGVSALGIGLIPSAIIGTQTAARYNDMVEELDRREVEHSFDRKSSVFGGEAGAFANLKDVNEDEKTGFGDTWLGDTLGFDGEFGNQGPTLQGSRQGARRDTTSPATISSSSSSSSSGGLWKAITGRTFNETFGGGGNNTSSSTPSSPSSSSSSSSPSSSSPSSSSPSSSSPSSSSSSSSGGGFWKAATGTAFKDTATGRALGLS